MKKKNPWLIPTIILLVFSILLTAAIPVTAYYETMINAALNAQTQKIIPGENSKIFYWTDYESEEDLVNNDMAVCRQVEAEGAALLLNKNNAQMQKCPCFPSLRVTRCSRARARRLWLPAMP